MTSLDHRTCSPRNAPAPSIAAEEIERNGFCVMRGLLSGSEVADLDATISGTFEKTPMCRGGFYGNRTKRFGRLLVRAPSSHAMARHPAIVALVSRVLGPWCDCIQLNVMQAIEVHPGEIAQVPHRDQDMWAGEKGRIEYLVNVMWPLTPFRAENGATHIWPGSHGIRALDEAHADNGMPICCEPGDAIAFLGSTLHRAGANLSAHPRRGIVIGYSLGWLKPYENPWLAYPPHVARDFPADLAALAGYRQHRPNLGNYEGQCPSVLLGDPVPDNLPAIDALTGEQAMMVAGHVAREHARAERKTP
ncbi:phytanoyl-CoA dioxygenase family protein [Novosphingobium malaysiense]|uniref:phytanoyl-CoA dioxygenase family protein n=1 Tax=Novosphingobium malaysiense TaxID=1348853 RepID=UPI00068C2615|nr:phytanoyl-CoA dioxygenase family protein [Novosphingobium malaysiense]